jgi:hypothetical protein
MDLAVRIENARRPIYPHSASSVLVADTFDGNALFEIGVEWQRRGGFARTFKNVDAAIFGGAQNSPHYWGVYEGRLFRRSPFVNSVSNWTRHLNCSESDRPQLLGELTLRPKWKKQARQLAF